TEQADYDAFGNVTNGGLSTRYQFTGREYDNYSGLYYYRARWYDSQLGRFISEDPIGFAGGDINLYGYVKNNPIRFTDPFGLDDADRIFEETYFPQGYEKWVRDNGIDKIWMKEVYDHANRPENYRCGPGYFSFPLSAIPQHPFGYNFKDTGCYNHDVCYGACGKKKEDCDNAILDDLQNECMSKGNVF
ncbi:MAG TPA: RHS repeat-associated core domain-containing protein, partial [Pyrinomonadaceae bacterium]